MSESKSALENLIGSLKQQRDELNVKIHLAGMEAKGEYGRLSKKVDQLDQQFEPVRDAVEDSAGNVFAALSLAAEEMKNGFERVSKAITDEVKKS